MRKIGKVLYIEKGEVFMPLPRNIERVVIRDNWRTTMLYNTVAQVTFKGYDRRGHEKR